MKVLLLSFFIIISPIILYALLVSFLMVTTSDSIPQCKSRIKRYINR